MTAPETQTIASAGWRLAAGFACRDAENFVILAQGEDFGAAHRGAAIVLTQGDAQGAQADEAAQLAARLFVDGFYGVLGALSPSLAAARALEAANSWFDAQNRADPFRAGMAASLAAALFPSSHHMVLLHLGAVSVFLRRDGALTRLAAPHWRRLREGPPVLSRGLGLNQTIFAQSQLIEIRPGDRLILLGGASDATPQDMDPQRLAENFGAAAVIDIKTLPTEAIDFTKNFENLPVRPPPREGEILDDFEIGKTIYRGAYTVLKRARDRLDDREVALKFPLPAMAQDEVFRAGFYREAWLGEKIRAKNVADYLDLKPGRRSQLYLATPFYRGQTLGSRLAAAPPVSLQEGVAIALKLCEAIDSLGKAQVIHRDIKPENIFVCADGEVRLLDLGLAALPGLDDPNKDQLGGTTRFMAPELFRGAPPSETSEIFSLGVSLYQMFSGGDFPFGRRENPILRARPDLPLWLKTLLASAIDFNPSKRPHSAQNFREQILRGLAEGDKSPPKPPRRIPEIWLWRGLCALLALGLVLSLTGR